ncbi:helicase associated domain-containing protein [uncultured Robinsoniella sp.]|uniref:helicase associated domain-containing protein n=1 Tax=uncultured Robinsoniella sp. TaxID=904190 RepID=UPI00374F84FB
MNDSTTVKKRNYTRLSWDEWYMLAKDFYISNHHLKVPNYYKTAEGFLLGRWIERQRTAYHQKNNYKIDARRIYLLNQIGMIWSLGIRRKWEIWYEYCEEYYVEKGNIDIPKGFTYNQAALGEWIIYQRKCYHKSKLSEYRRVKLEALGMNWQIRNRRSDSRI